MQEILKKQFFLDLNFCKCTIVPSKTISLLINIVLVERNKSAHMKAALRLHAMNQVFVDNAKTVRTLALGRLEQTLQVQAMTSSVYMYNL